MRSKSFILFLAAFLVLYIVTSAQTNTASTKPDDDFNAFLLVFAVVVVSLMIGASLAGSFLATGLLLLMAAFVSAGILSVSILAGIYKRSLTTGFKIFLYIACPIAGILTGVTGFYIIIHLFHPSIPDNAGFFAGIIGGLLGGLLMAFAVSKIAITLTRYLSARFSQTSSGSQK